MITLVVYFTLVLARVGTFVAVLPVLGGPNVPRLVKVGLTFALTFLFLGCMFQTVPATDFFKRAGQVVWLDYGLALGREAVLGALLGFAFGLILVPAHVAGEYLTEELGLSFGNFLNPAGGTATGSLTPLFEAFAILLFLGLDGHHVFFAVLQSTFVRFPVGGPLAQIPVQPLVAGASAAQEMGLLLAAPVGVCLFASTLVLALMTRAAPQLNLFSIGFPLRLIVGLVALLVLLPGTLSTLVNMLGRMSEILVRLV